MKRSSMLPIVLLLTVMLPGAGARACGDSEAGLACDDRGTAAEDGAKWMLKRVVSAIATDKTKALDEFAHGKNGFRTADTYVFCVGPDGVMNAHPNPILQGHDVRDLHDETGNYFIKAMMQDAKPDEVSVIRYLFPKPGGTVALPKTTYYTRAGDQICGVGVYDGDGTSASPATAEERIARLRRKLDAEIPESAQTDWTAFLEALNAKSSEQDAAMARVREGLRLAQSALSPSGTATGGR